MHRNCERDYPSLTVGRFDCRDISDQRIARRYPDADIRCHAMPR
jgi:hypothetical protein